jgi:hypothetical protein
MEWYINQSYLKKMNKQEIEKITMVVNAGPLEALNIKVDKTGLVYRQGCGGLPEMSTSATAQLSESIFKTLVDGISQEILDAPVNYEESGMKTPLEYIITLYGGGNPNPADDETWAKSTVVRFLMDNDTSFRHPQLSFADKLALDAAELTNSWYFDVLIDVRYGNKSTSLPAKNTISAPKSESDRKDDFDNYASQIRSGVRAWDLTALAKDKVYILPDKTKATLEVKIAPDMTYFTFDQLEAPQHAELAGAPAEKKKWWQL